MSHTPRPTHTVDSGDPLGSANIASIDWNALMNRRAAKRTYEERDSSCGSGRSSVNSFLSEDFGSGPRSPSPEGPSGPWGLAALSRRNKQVPPPHTSRRDGKLDPDAPIWAQRCSDWNAKWRSEPAESALQQEQGLAGNAPDLVAQLSSSSSLSLTAGDSSAPSQEKRSSRRSKHPRKSFAKAVNETIQNRVIKRKVKKLFTRLTAQLGDEELGSSQGWRQRRVAGEELLRIAQDGGGAVVARRFTKSLARQETGLRAILRLCEEEDLASGPSQDKDESFKYDRHHKSYLLMVLVMLHVDRALFLETVIPSILREPIGYGPRGILFLATSIPDFFARVDPVAIFEYGMRVIRKSEEWTSPWFQGTELLYRLFGHNPATEQGKSTMLSVGRLILDSAMELYSSSSAGSLVYTRFLQVVVRISSIAEAKGILASILPSPAVVDKFIDHVISEQSRDSWFNKFQALQVKAITLLADSSQITSASPHQLEQLGNLCIEVIGSTMFWQLWDPSSLGLDPRVPLALDKDALSILCKLPEPVFQQELRLFIFPKSELDIPPPPSLPADYDPFRIISRRLDLLLWLSNARENTTEIHRALIGSDSCGFLQNTAASRVSSTWYWGERGVWRDKGLAMTCFGNIMEKMDESELRGHVPREMIETAVAIKDDEEAPMAQRGQAIFMLQRYTVAADRCGIEPYHREAGAATED